MNKMDKLSKIVDVVKATEEAGLEKAKVIIDDVKSYDISDVYVPSFLKKEEPIVQKKRINWGLVAVVVVGIVAVAAAIYGMYRYFTPDYLDDFDDDFDDDEFEDDDFFEDDEDKKD